MLERCAVRHAGKTKTQDPFALRITALQTIHIGQVDVGRYEERVEAERGIQLGFGLRSVALLGIEGPQVGVPVRTVGTVALGCCEPPRLPRSKAARCSKLN